MQVLLRCRQEFITVSLQRVKTADFFETAFNLTSTIPNFEHVGFNVVKSRDSPTSVLYSFAVEHEKASISTHIVRTEDDFDERTACTIELVTPIQGYERTVMEAHFDQSKIPSGGDKVIFRSFQIVSMFFFSFS